MYRAELHKTVGAPWIAMEPICVGPGATGAGTPGVYVSIEQDGVPFARIDAWPPHEGPFTQVLTWRNFVVLGWNDQVHIVDPATRAVKSIECDGYFGHMYSAEDRLLIADAHRLACIDDRGKQLWASDALGIDGVVVDQISGDIIFGQGEWDPPGGWRPFQVFLSSGRAAAG